MDMLTLSPNSFYLGDLGGLPRDHRFFFFFFFLHREVPGTRSSHCGAVETNPTRNHEVAGSIPGHDQ